MEYCSSTPTDKYCVGPATSVRNIDKQVLSSTGKLVLIAAPVARKTPAFPCELGMSTSLGQGNLPSVYMAVLSGVVHTTVLKGDGPFVDFRRRHQGHRAYRNPLTAYFVCLETDIFRCNTLHKRTYFYHNASSLPSPVIASLTRPRAAVGW